MTETEKMLAGELYDPSDAELTALRTKAHSLSMMYNQTPETDEHRRTVILEQLLPNHGPNVTLLAPLHLDYGCFTSIGQNTFANFNLTILDCCPVSIGNDVFIGPNVSLLTPMHPLRWQDRNLYHKEDGTWTDREYARPIAIGDNCWIAGGVTICGGVTIGEGSVIGAGSVVTRDIPPNVFAAGVPCKVIRPIAEADKM